MVEITRELKPIEVLSRSGRWCRMHPEYNLGHYRVRLEKIGIQAINSYNRNMYKQRYNDSNDNYKDRILRNRKKYIEKSKLLALQMISGMERPSCSCGCDYMPILQVHHKNGDGKEERTKLFPGYTLYTAIINRKRDTKDLEVKCIICNWTEWVERKIGNYGTFRVNFEKA